MSMDSFNAVELRELRGGGGRRGVSPTPASASRTVSGAARGFENASYQQDEEHDHQQQQQAAANCPPSTSGNSKVSLGGSYILHITELCFFLPVTLMLHGSWIHKIRVHGVTQREAKRC